jgi:DNA-binding NtrC family response regulator
VAHILLVDDDESQRITVSILLSDEGHTVLEADSLASAREALAGGRFDLVLLDRTLEDGLGTDLLPEIRAASPATRILLVTGDDRYPVPELADGRILKGGPPANILRQIRETLAK